MSLVDVLTKVRDEATWKSYLVCDETQPNIVLGGCVIRELTPQQAELSLMAVRSNAQKGGLGRILIDELKKRYEKIITFADLRALGFYRKMGFMGVPKGCSERIRLLKQIESCTYSELMQYTSELNNKEQDQS